MLGSLFGSQNVKTILLFLFVNGKCYGTQMHRCLGMALTPLQKGLARLEKGGVIQNYYEGKTKVFQFNPAYPLLEELEQLLKKAYTLLSVQDKKKFSFIREQRFLEPGLHAKNSEQILEFWTRLSQVKELVFQAKFHLPNRWASKGTGQVTILKESETQMIFHEKGTWKTMQGQEIDFRNAFRWTLDRENGQISLEHLRQGVERPVFLFHLIPSKERMLTSVDSHLYDGDICFGQVFCERDHVRLNWRVIGSSKNEEIDYFYSK